jgi:hypothetical protein
MHTVSPRFRGPAIAAGFAGRSSSPPASQRSVALSLWALADQTTKMRRNNDATADRTG